MSVLFLGGDLRGLADGLADALDADAKRGDFFTPTRVVVPNRYVRKWLRLHLARKLDVAINLDYQSLEDALWQLLKQVDPRQAAEPEPIDANTYRLMVLSVLLEESDPDLAPLQRYLQRHGSGLSRLSCRRAWYLAERLGALLQEYEYHRQDALIQPWLRGERGGRGDNDFHRQMARAQAALFAHITREPAGKRALLSVRGGLIRKTFPQYAMEVMEGAAPETRPGDIVHFFGFTQFSELHARTIGWLGRYFDLRVYHLNPFAPRLHEAADLPALLDAVAALRTAPGAEDRAAALLHDWGNAGLESLHVLAQRLPPSDYQLQAAPAAPTTRPATVLARLQDRLLGRSDGGAPKLPQDASLQIVGCPGVVREVETVYNSILHNLQTNPSLRQTDVAILVTDMPRYRTALQGVFERPPAALQYNLVDFNAAGVSTYGQALLGMLDLALESFSRKRVFEVILNPCFLARLGADHATALTWLEWAERLGIYQGWNADEKQQQGYAASPLYAWQLGLRRLRLGRYMAVAREDGEQPAPRFAGVIPFADLESTEREDLDAFCRAIEGLLPSLARLRNWQATGKRWAGELERLMNAFLDVPTDRPEETQVREALLAALEQLERWDFLRDASRKDVGMPLALVREFVLGQLTSLPGNRGEYLIGGVTIATLQRPLPFAVVYILGLGDDLFPGSNALSSFDLRTERLPGDVRPAEGRLHDFLLAVLSAQQKLYLVYNNHDLARDQALLPAVAVQQLKRFLGDDVLKSPFQAVQAPAQGDDPALLNVSAKADWQDVLVQYRDVERCLAIAALHSDHRLALDARQQKEWDVQRAKLRRYFAIDAEPTSAPPASVTVSLRDLRRFLELPAQESLRRHLYVQEAYDDSLDDDEPLVTPKRAANGLVRRTIERLIRTAATGDVDDALAHWKEQFEATYADARLRCQVPEAAFGDIDQKAILADLNERIHGQGQLDAFLKEHAGMTFCGPLLIGESTTPIGARLRFPALRLRPGQELPAEAPYEIRLTGWTTFAWHAPERMEILVFANDEKPYGTPIASFLLEPALMHLALLAGTEPNHDGIPSRQWIGRRTVRLHAACSDGILTWTYPRQAISPLEATQYLGTLARDLLEPGAFDLLPFKLMQDKKLLSLAVAAAPALSPQDFQMQLIEAIEDARETAYQRGPVPALVEMIRPRVPVDALAKVRRRFQLLERGPASLRQQRPVRKARERSPS